MKVKQNFHQTSWYTVSMIHKKFIKVECTYLFFYFFSRNCPNHCLSHLISHEGLAAVSFSSGVPWFGGVGLGLGLMGKPRCAWVGAWVFGGGDVEMMWWGWEYAWGYYLDW